MFADLELIGIPYRITVGERGLKQGVAEIYSRHDGESRETELQSVVSHLKSTLCLDT
jgi:prolyl-tRNA synthetase